MIFNVSALTAQVPATVQKAVSYPLIAALAVSLFGCGGPGESPGELGTIDLDTVGAPEEIAAGYSKAVAEYGPDILAMQKAVQECWAATDLDEMEEMECMLLESRLNRTVNALNSSLSSIWHDLDDPDWAPDPSAPAEPDGLSGLALSFPSGPQVGRHPAIDEKGLVARTAEAVDDHSGSGMTPEKLDRLVGIIEEWRGEPGGQPAVTQK